MKARALAGPSFLADHLPNALQFLRHLLVSSDNRIEGVGNLPFQAGPGSREPDRKVAVPHGLKAGQDRPEVSRLNHTNGIPVTLLDRMGFAIDDRSRRRLVVSLHRALLHGGRSGAVIFSGRTWPPNTAVFT